MWVKKWKERQRQSCQGKRSQKRNGNKKKLYYILPYYSADPLLSGSALKCTQNYIPSPICLGFVPIASPNYLVLMLRPWFVAVFCPFHVRCTWCLGYAAMRALGFTAITRKSYLVLHFPQLCAHVTFAHSVKPTFSDDAEMCRACFRKAGHVCAKELVSAKISANCIVGRKSFCRLLLCMLRNRSRKPQLILKQPSNIIKWYYVGKACASGQFFLETCDWMDTLAFILNQTKVAVSPPKLENRFPNFFQATQMNGLDRVAAFTNRGLHQVVWQSQSNFGS